MSKSPLLAPFQKRVEELITDAIAKGEFDNLKGKGQPLDLDEDQHIPVELRMAYRMLKRAGIPPEEVFLAKSASSLRAKLLNDPTLSEDERKAIKRQLMNVDLEYNMRIERFRKQYGGY